MPNKPKRNFRKMQAQWCVSVKSLNSLMQSADREYIGDLYVQNAKSIFMWCIVVRLQLYDIS